MPKERLQSVDLVRGLIMVIMAVDHVRDMLATSHFDPMEPSRTNAALYLTRIITHLCAPGFVLLAGTGAFLSGKPRGELARFLLSRGLWLAVIEVTVVKLAWTFNFELQPLVVQVIWVLGLSMVFLAALIWLPMPAIAAFGVAMIALHNLFDGAAQVAPLLSPQATARDLFISLVHVQNFPVIYPLVPWVGVMALGYALGPVFTRPDRQRWLVILGLGCCAAFVLLRAFHLYGDPVLRDPAHPVYSFFRTEKYPPSLHYLLMTLGPIFLLLAAAERVRAPALLVFGRVPFFFYLLHLYAIHAIAVVVGVSTGFPASAFLVPWTNFPEGFGVGLAATWVAWALIVLALYPACRWFAQVKATRRDWWLSYV